MVAPSHAQFSDALLGSRLGLNASGTPERRSSSPRASASETFWTCSRAGRSSSATSARLLVPGVVWAVAPPVIGASRPASTTPSASTGERGVGRGPTESVVLMAGSSKGSLVTQTA